MRAYSGSNAFIPVSHQCISNFDSNVFTDSDNTMPSGKLFHVVIDPRVKLFFLRLLLGL